MGFGKAVKVQKKVAVIRGLKEQFRILHGSVLLSGVFGGGACRCRGPAPAFVSGAVQQCCLPVTAGRFAGQSIFRAFHL
ncbi:MAG TPA: hypothetical protein H9857_01130 [Candidatus Desulfovibrio intestinigallinarum]|nr:hypothetical protein [Candidatus Desulfovibrio intestinigallinarum]